MKYRLLRDTPLHKAGAIFEERSGSIYGPGGDGYYPLNEIGNFSEWFAPVDERWKPDDGQEYWVVDFEISDNTYSSKWDDDISDNNRWNFGNCFHNQEEAEYAAEEVKKFLFFLQKDN